MIRQFIFLMLIATSAFSQTKKANPKSNNVAKDTSALVALKSDTMSDLEKEIRAERKFGVYTRKAKCTDNKMRLCVQLTSPKSVFELCVADSACKYPEKYKILFEKQQGDTNYVLVHVEGFSKEVDMPTCNAGKEIKLFYFRWNTSTNKAIWKQRTISSCVKNVTNMTKEPIGNWDGKSVLTLNYYRGGSAFIELKFDPDNYLLGFQSSGAE